MGKKQTFKNHLDQDGDGYIDGPAIPKAAHGFHHSQYAGRDPNGRFLPAYLTEHYYFLDKPTRKFFFLLGAGSVIIIEILFAILWWAF
jgi:hypothetical protein